MSYLKGTTRIQAIAMRKIFPCYSASRIAKDIGVSRERIRQILTEEDLPRNKIDLPRFCLYCGSQIQRQTSKSGTWINKVFCNQECRKKYHNIPVCCSQCERIFMRKASKVLSYESRPVNLVFCSRYCHGVWLGNHYGNNRKKTNANN